jgi:replication factor A1
VSEYILKVGELRTYSRRVNLLAKVLEVGEPREVSSSSDNRLHQVAEALIGDSTGTVLLTLWDENIGKFQEGDVVKIENGYSGTYRSRLRLNIGKYGDIKKVNTKIDEINMKNNMSERDFGTNYRRRDRRIST